MTEGRGGGRRAIQALVLSWIGIGLTLPYYGAETFGLHAIGQEDIDLFILIYFFLMESRILPNCPEENQTNVPKKGYLQH